MRPVYVEWEDASGVDSSGGWVFREGAPAPSKVIFKHLGFVVSQDDEALVLTEAHSQDQMSPRTRIPAGMVRVLVELGPAIKRGTRKKGP